MDNMEKIAAVNWEARRRGLTYGQLAANLTGEEQEELYIRFRRAKAAQAAREKLELERKKKKSAAVQ